MQPLPMNEFVQENLNQVGFDVTPVSAEHPALRRLGVLPAALRKIVVELPVMLFQTVEILVRKPLGLLS